MYNIVFHTRKFDTDRSDDLEYLSEIKNNPLCTITDERWEKVTECDFNEEGKMSSKKDYMVKVITWDEKVLI